MISFGLTEEQEVVREAMRDFAQEVLRPAARECDEAEAVPDALLQQVWELGLTSTQIPEAYGGAGEPRSPVTQALALEALAYGDAALALAATAPSLFAFAVLDHGSEEQKQRYLPAFGGERFHAATLAWCEPGPLFDPLNLRTRVEPKGEGFVLSGAKCAVPLGDRAETFLVVARNPQGDGFGALEAFIVPRDAAGVHVAGPEKNLGLRGLPTATLELERVEVPGSARLGGEAGLDGRRLLASTRVGAGAVLAGLSRAVMDYAIPYARDRHAFGEAIARKQAIAFMLADMRIESDAMRWLTWKAASQLEQGLDASRAAQHVRLYAAAESMKIADNGVQVLGGHGFIREHPVELWYRQARTLGVLEGVAIV